MWEGGTDRGSGKEELKERKKYGGNKLGIKKRISETEDWKERGSDRREEGRMEEGRMEEGRMEEGRMEEGVRA